MQRQDTVQSLFKKWQRGDGEAGDAMADRFELWFKSLTVLHLGTNKFSSSYEEACTQFSKDILSVTKPSDLIPFAHKILNDKIKQAGAIDTGGDFSNAMLQNRSPQALIHSVWSDLTPEEQRLLRGLYGSAESIESLKNQLQLQNGLAYACLSAREKLKKLLQEQKEIPFSLTEDSNNWDLCPLPLFEAEQLANPKERQLFERWMLNSVPLCKDIIEFAPFVHTMRNGALQRLPTIGPSEEDPGSIEEHDQAIHNPSIAEEDNKIFKMIFLGIILAIVVLGLTVIIFSWFK